MALFKILKGLKNNLPSTKKDGYCYFTTDDQMFYIDYLDSNNQLQRKPLNANDAITLLGKGVVETLTNDANNIPTAAAVYVETSSLQTQVDEKMNKNNPVGTGSFSMNGGSATGDYSIALAEKNAPDSTIASGTNSFAMGFGSESSGYISFAQGEWATASGQYSHAEGEYTTASKRASHAEGSNTTASGDQSHAEGRQTTASGNYSHAEGQGTNASGVDAHTEGYRTNASGADSHAEGESTKAIGVASHAEGSNTTAKGSFSHASGNNTQATHKSQFVIGEFNALDDSSNAATQRGNYAFLIGNGTSSSALGNALTVKWTGDFWVKGSIANATSVASGAASFASGNSTASGAYSHAEGAGTQAGGVNSHAEGNTTSASGVSSHAEGELTEATAFCAHAEGNAAIASGNQSHAEGEGTAASGISSHAEGENTSATKQASHAEGSGTTANGLYSHAEGFSTTASGEGSHAEGKQATASSDGSHAEGIGTEASGQGSHAEGSFTIASGTGSHAEGGQTQTIGAYSHAGGFKAIANNEASFAHGYDISANAFAQTVFGMYNETSATDIFQIGGGTSDTDRFNAFSITSAGAAKIKSSLNIGGATDETGRANMLYVSGDGYVEGGIRAGSNYYPSDNKDLVTKDYVINNLPQLTHIYQTATADGTTSFDFSDTISSLSNFYLVYFNGLLLIEDVHYTVDGAVVNLLDWSCRANDICHVVSLMPLNPDASSLNVAALIGGSY